MSCAWLFATAWIVASVHGILQARILKWVAIPFFKGSSQPMNQTCVSHIASGYFTVWATKEALMGIKFRLKFYQISSPHWDYISVIFIIT